MTHAPSSHPSDGDLGVEVDRLLRQMPGRHRVSGEEPRSGPHAAPSPRSSGAFGAKPSPRFSPAIVQQVGTWSRVLLAGGLALAVLSWPYAHGCGWRLDLYLAVVFAVMVAGGWASVCAWRSRIAGAHVLALVVVFWGIVLSAEQILPRIEYAASPASWRCGS